MSPNPPQVSTVALPRRWGTPPLRSPKGRSPPGVLALPRLFLSLSLSLPICPWGTLDGLGEPKPPEPRLGSVSSPSPTQPTAGSRSGEAGTRAPFAQVGVPGSLIAGLSLCGGSEHPERKCKARPLGIQGRAASVVPSRVTISICPHHPRPAGRLVNLQ